MTTGKTPRSRQHELEKEFVVVVKSLKRSGCEAGLWWDAKGDWTRAHGATAPQSRLLQTRAPYGRKWMVKWD